MKTHGLTNTKIYRTHQGMLNRCYREDNDNFSEYGGRGVLVCERWWTFENFVSDMGFPPSEEHTLDRIDVDGDYEPSNCRWATRKEQDYNKRNTRKVMYQGKLVPIGLLAEKLGFKYQALYARVVTRGMPVEEALAKPFYPKRPKGYRNFNGFS